MILNIFQPMYDLCGFGDAWSFWSVHATKDREKATIVQNSRFGIGDVTFLAMAFGRCEYVEDTLKRVSKLTLHLTSGRRLENIVNIIKALGLLGDYTVDRLHKLTKMVGVWCEGDYRRPLAMDAPGMNAANFSTFSVLGSIGQARSWKVLHDYPNEYYRLQGMGVLQQLPVNKVHQAADDRPCYVYDVKHAMTAGIVVDGACPKMQMLGLLDGDYKYKMYHTSHSSDYFLQECIKSWDEYQTQWNDAGFKHDYIPYPYTREMMEGYFEKLSTVLGYYISSTGPEDNIIGDVPKEPELGETPGWAGDDNAMAGCVYNVDTDHKEWWANRGGSRSAMFLASQFTNPL
jgi:hypothetical protein